MCHFKTVPSVSPCRLTGVEIIAYHLAAVSVICQLFSKVHFPISEAAADGNIHYIFNGHPRASLRYVRSATHASAPYRRRHTIIPLFGTTFHTHK